MAALEKIRKRSWILVIIIALGLLAFIFEDGAKAMGAFFHDNSVAIVGNEKIDAQTFNQRVEQVSQQQEGQKNKQDASVIAQQVLQQMELETVLNDECDANSIEVSNEEVCMLMDQNQNVQTWAQQYMEATGTKLQRPSDLDKYMNTETLAPIRAQWEQMKEECAFQLKAQKLNMLAMGALQANNLDIAQAKEDAGEYYVDVTKKAYTFDTNKYKPTEDEIKAVYEADKARFKLDNPERLIYYITSPIEPSPADTKKAEAIIAKGYNVLAQPNGCEAIKTLGDFACNESKVTVKQALDAMPNDSAYKAWVGSASAGSAPYKSQVAGSNVCTLVKVKQIDDALPDTAKCTIVGVKDAKNIQAVLAQLNAGKKPADIKEAEGSQPQTIPVQSLQDDTLKNRIVEAQGKYVAYTSAQGSILLKTDSLSYNKFITLVTASYDIVASDATTNAIETKLDAYVASCKDADAFYKNAAAKGFKVETQYIGSSTPELGYNPQFAQYGGGGIENTRKAIKWAMTDAVAGQVSTVFHENTNVLVAVAVKAVYDADYMPLSDAQVRDYCTKKAMMKKEAAALTAQYQGKAKDVAGYAKLFGDSIQSTQVTFEAGQMEAGLLGAIAGSKAKLNQTKFYAGEAAVYAFCVKKYEATKQKLTNDQWKQKWAQSHASGMGLQNIILRSVKIKDNLVQFQ